MSYVFIDDLHCLDPNRKLDSAVELLRMLVEHRQAIHPTSNQVTSCSNVLPLASVQANVAFNTSQHHDTIRLLNRFVPVTLPALTDAELSSICMAIVSPNDSGAALSSADATVRDFHKAHQLFAIIVKCTIKLFRFMSGEFSQCAAKVSFVPSKLHYMFHVHNIFDIVRSVFCDGGPTLTLAEKPYLARLWCHESARTLGDRLIEPKETVIFYQHVRDLALHSFGLAPEVFIPPHADLPIEKTDDTSYLWLANHLYFAFVGECSGAGFMDGYHEVTEIQKVELSIERSMMAMHCANMSSESLEIVICRYVTQHVLRLTRLLRNEDRNILLIGSRGNKMATITRLAAFICRKTAVLYNKSTSSVSQNSESLVGWKHELRSAILASVRKKDENIVFIFKDSHLLETGHYDAIERFVSGAQLSSDILAYEHLDGHLLSTLRDQMHQEQEENRANKLAAQTILSTKSSVLEYFYAQVRKKFQMVVILSDPHANMLPIKNENLGSRTAASRLARLFWQTPRILKHCTVNYFGEWPEESLSAIAHKCFALSSEIEKERAVQFAQAAVQIYQSTRRFYARCSESPEVVKEGRGDPANELLSELDQENEDAVNSVQFSSLDRPLPIQLDPSMLIAQICLFLKFLGRLSREITANKSKYHTGLSFLEQTEQILVAEQAQAEVLQPEMQKRADFTRRMSGTLEKEKIASSKLNRALDLATSLVEAQRERLANVEAEYQELVKDSMAVFKQMQTNIRMFQVAKSEESGEEQSSLDSPDPMQGNNAAAADADKDTESQDTNVESVQESLNGQEGLRSKEAEASVVECLTQEEPKERELKQHRRALIKSFASFKPVPTALMQLAECLGLIFGFQPVEARDKLDPDEIFMDYWENMTARLKTKAFWDELIVFDVEAHVNDKILGQVLPICSSPDFEKEMFASIHELAGSLCEWVQAWSRLARDIILAGPKFAQLMQEREAFKSAQAEVKARELEIQVQHNTTSEANALRHLSEVERQEIEDRLHDNVSTLQIAFSVWKVVASSRNKWKERYQYYTEFSAQWMGDLMIATAIVSYTSYASDKTRESLRANWSNELRKHYLIHSVDRALHEVFLVGNVQLTRWHLDGIPSKDACAAENAVIVSSSYHFPLLLDPYGIAVAWVKQYEATNKLQVLNSQVASEESLWNEIDTAVKKQNALMLTDFCEESACALRSLIGAKRRALFEVVNRDISSSSTVITGSGSSTMPRLGDGSEAINHPCWFQIPQSAKQHGGSTSLQQQTQKAGAYGSKITASLSTVVFGSESWRVYFVYSRSESVPEWMLQYASQLRIVRFHFSARFVETHCVSKVADAYGEQHLLTEIQTLQVDILSYQEQIDAIENEILDFFSTEQPQDVYSEVSKALRIIDNRSAMHTLESSKTESESKIRSNRTQLDRFAGLVHRGVDFAYAWRDIAWITSEMQLAANENSGRRSDPLFALPWVWKLLAKALQQYEPRKSFEEMASIYTETVREFVTARLHDDGQLLFDFLLSLRLHSRRRHDQHHSSATSDIVVEIEPGFEKDPTLSVHKDAEVVCRLMLLLQCEDETQLKQLCSFVPPKLVALRPDSLSPQQWRALCFLADASADLHDFMLQHADRKGKATGHDSWTELLKICSSSNSPNPSPPLNPLSEVVRLCAVCAMHKDLTLREIERFVAFELTTCLHPEVAPVSPDPKLSMRTLDGAAFPLLAHPGFGSLKANSFNSLYELWRTFSSSRTPIVVNCAPGFDFVSRVADVALRAKMTMNPSLYETLIRDDAFERNLRAAMQKGHWVVAPNLHAMPQRLARVQKLYQTLEERDLHSDFRLWVSSHVQWADIFVDKWAIRKLQGGMFALKRSLIHAFTVMKDNTTCQTLEANYEKVLKRVGLLHAVLTTQSHFGFAFWKSEFAFDDGDLQAVIGTLSKLDPQAEVTATEADQLRDTI
uniref:Uncharacterized protein n=1 Tax=Globisporangium ultimum (strain ATCC 200006 / CBS 805.95 / DAOM BR144) TaxID=431595 RepID=K3WBQ3_GLOUD